MRDIRRSLHDANRQGRPLILPAAHDAFSARLIEQAGFDAFVIAGSPVLAARYALPDIGLTALGEMSAAIQDIAAATTLPFIADGDDGYGDTRCVARMMQSYERLGVSGVTLEDQARVQKQPGDKPSSALVPGHEFEDKIRAAIEARSSSDLLVFARTDSLALLGLDGAMKRSERYLTAGADGIFIPGLRSTDEFRRVGSAFRGQYLLAALTEDGTTALPDPRELYSFGFNLIAYPNYLMLRIADNLSATLSQLLSSTMNGAPALSMPNLSAARSVLQAALQRKHWEIP